MALLVVPDLAGRTLVDDGADAPALEHVPDLGLGTRLDLWADALALDGVPDLVVLALLLLAAHARAQVLVPHLRRPAHAGLAAALARLLVHQLVVRAVDPLPALALADVRAPELLRGAVAGVRTHAPADGLVPDAGARARLGGHRADALALGGVPVLWVRTVCYFLADARLALFIPHLFGSAILTLRSHRH